MLVYRLWGFWDKTLHISAAAPRRIYANYGGDVARLRQRHMQVYLHQQIAQELYRVSVY